jgi:hypothetical protein
MLVLIIVFGVTLPGYADLTLKQTIGGKGLGMASQGAGTTYFKGARMRSDVVIGDRTQTTIFDLDGQKLYIFDSRRKEADVWDMAAFAAELSQHVDAEGMKVSLAPTGQTKMIAGQNAERYDLEITVPASMGGTKDMSMVVTLSGPTWIVKDAPGSADYLRFYKAAAEKGWILSDPRAAKGSPGQARAMTEMYKQLAEAGGIAYETDIQIKMNASGGGGNPLGGLLSRIGNISATSTVQSVETGPLDDALFMPPAGYKLNARK